MRSALRGGVAKGGVQPHFDHAPRDSGLVTAAGFLAAFVLTRLDR
jgi:hypothetical protein